MSPSNIGTLAVTIPPMNHATYSGKLSSSGDSCIRLHLGGTEVQDLPFAHPTGANRMAEVEAGANGARYMA